MPTYEYACGACAHQWEVVQRITEPPVELCPACARNEAHRLISRGTNFILKGGGWYSDLYASPKEAPKENPKSEAPAGGNEAKTETKTGAEAGAEPRAEPRADDDSFPQWPDLVIIDGGRGQLGAAREIFEGLGLNQVALLAVAKGPDRDAGRETLFMPDREAIKLEPRDPVLYFIQRLRDEAHRFVIGSHRKLRKKDIREAGLQEIPGIGPSRKRALLHHFGTLKEIERASVGDLGKVPGVSAESARKIFEFFHARPG